MLLPLNVVIPSNKFNSAGVAVIVSVAAAARRATCPDKSGSVIVLLAEVGSADVSLINKLSPEVVPSKAIVLSSATSIVSLINVVCPVTIKSPGIVISSFASPIEREPPCDVLSNALAAAAAVV